MFHDVFEFLYIYIFFSFCIIMNYEKFFPRYIYLYVFTIGERIFIMLEARYVRFLFHSVISKRDSVSGGC